MCWGKTFRPLPNSPESSSGQALSTREGLAQQNVTAIILNKSNTIFILNEK